MKVLVLGSSGFIGLSVAQAFVRAGHMVYGQTRSAQTANRVLAKHEIIPVVCDPLTDAGLAAWGEVSERVDVVIDCTATKGSTGALKIAEQFRAVAVKRPLAAPKPTYIYTGGLWSWSRGAGGLETWTDERQPRSAYNDAVGWREDIEDVVLTVVRPPILYGGGGSFLGYYIFDAAYDAAQNKTSFETVVRNDTRWQTIHPDDLGDAYVKIAEVGQTFFPANPQTERLTDVLDAVVRVSGAKGWEGKEAQEPIDRAWVSTLNSHPSLTTALTGWRPRKMSLVDGMDIYWSAYVAHRKSKL